MATLLLRLAAPLQAWGTDSKFETRRTGREPSKSGIIGLLAAAQGRRRNEALDDLAALHFGVRVEQEGTLLHDFHIAQAQKTSYVTHRYYLEDAVFLVGLEGDTVFLEKLENALQNPKFPLFLGRRSCPPEFPLVLGIRPIGLLETLQAEPWQASEYRQKRCRQSYVELRLMTDALAGERCVAFQRDLPLSFSPIHRQFTNRGVILRPPVRIPLNCPDAGTANTEHDFWEEMEVTP